MVFPVLIGQQTFTLRTFPDRLREPFHEVYDGQLIATCSPDEGRCKEFQKRSYKVLYALLDTG